MNYTRISADCHIDMPWIPDDLFTANASRGDAGPDAVRRRRPRRPALDVQERHVVRPGRRRRPRRARRWCPGQNYRVDKMAAIGLYDDGKKGIRRPTDPHLRIKDMELDGVQAEVIFGILGAATRLNDHEAAKEMFRIYNDWLMDFCRHYPDRQIGLACLPYGDIDAAVKEVHRVAKMGLRGPGAVVLVGHGADVASHVGAAVEGGQRREPAAALPHLPDACRRACARRPDRPRPAAPRCSPASPAFQMNLVNILAAIIGAAVLERYPNLRIAFGESGIGWIPYALDRMDFEWEDRFRDLGLTMKPSDYWRRQCKATFQFDRIGTQLIDEMGVETLMWALRLSAHRRRVAGVVEVHRGAVRPPAGRRGAQDHLRERREVLRPHQVTRRRRASWGSAWSLRSRSCGRCTASRASGRWPRSTRRSTSTVAPSSRSRHSW